MHIVQFGLIASQLHDFGVEEIHTTAVIDAPAFVVWNIVADFPRYPEWNPFILKIRGILEVNSKLELELMLANEEVVHGEFTVTGAEKEREIAWSGKNGGNLLGVEHRLAIQPLAHNRVTFLQTAKFGGNIISLVASKLHPLLARQLESMNIALKQRAERSWKESPPAAG